MIETFVFNLSRWRGRTLSVREQSFLYCFLMQFSSQLDSGFETVSHRQSKRKSVFLSFFLAKAHEAWLPSSLSCFPKVCLCCNTFSDHVCSSCLTFPHILSKWNFTKGFADGGKLNLSASNWDADPQHVYKESLSSLLQKGAASITVSVPQTNPQSGKQHDLHCTFPFHAWSAVGLISRFSKVSLVLSGLC